MIYRTTASDFEVEEIPRFEPTGDGAHELLWIEKCELDTVAVALELAKLAHVPREQIGFAGRKDRFAVTRQWFSVPWGRLPDQVEIEGVMVLDRTRHDRRLRLGDLRGNGFRLRVREVPREGISEIRQRFEQMGEEGFDNFFGAQRFGRDGGNAEKGRRLLRGEERVGDRRLARLMVSALQSQLFNEVLERRRLDVGRIELVAGDVVRHHAGGSLRWIGEPSDEDRRRFRDGLTSPTGPLFGAKMRWPRPPADRWEREVLEFHALRESLFQGRGGLRIWGDRRALRATLSGGEFAVEERDSDREEASAGDTIDVVVEFTLQSGCYATVCLQQIFGPELREARRPTEDWRADAHGESPAGVEAP